MSRLYLSPPHMGDRELELVREAFESNWIAPLGPHVDAFEREFARLVGSPHAAAVSSGTAALHLAMRLAGVRSGDEVLCSSLTFVASANPILYQGAMPVFVDSEEQSWNMDPALLAEELDHCARTWRPPRAVILVHLYGQSANIDPIVEACNRHGVVLIEDAAEALGATYKQISPGTAGRMGIFSFNGNKIITTSGGGMLVSGDEALMQEARFLASQAREPLPYYEHTKLGYNYRMSNVLAAIGRGQLMVLEERVRARRRVFERYREALKDEPGITFMPEGPVEPLADGDADRRRRVRRQPGGRPPRARGEGNRGAPGVEADAPPAGVPLGPPRGRQGRGAPVPAGPLPAERLEDDGRGRGPGCRGDS
jgi:dTDP-4-amino-4,6-dideoxygalactose transaminase